MTETATETQDQNAAAESEAQTSQANGGPSLEPWVDEDKFVAQVHNEISGKFTDMLKISELFRKSMTSAGALEKFIKESDEQVFVEGRERLEKLNQDMILLRNKLRELATKRIKTDELSEEDAKKHRETFTQKKDETKAQLEALNEYSKLMPHISDELKAEIPRLIDAIPSLRGHKGAGTGGVSEADEARQWLKQNRPEIKVSERGRLSREAWEAYRNRAA